MRTWTLIEVREVLSAPAAMGFFERWTAATAARDRLLERLEDVRTQSVTAIGRARLADERARAHLERAELQRRRMALSPADVPLVRMEAEALVAAAEADAVNDQHEARERRRRAEALDAEAEAIRAEVAQSERALDRLWGEAGALGAHVGESCLFFASAEEPGGHFVLPLVSLALGTVRLEACVLHRLPAGAVLAAATPIRDVPAEGAGEAGEGADPFEPPREHAPDRA